MSTVQPIRPGVTPEMDVERELADFAAMHIRDFCLDHGEPRSIAIVIIGEKADHICSWSPRISADSRQVRAYAGARLLNEAVR